MLWSSLHQQPSSRLWFHQKYPYAPEAHWWDQLPLQTNIENRMYMWYLHCKCLGWVYKCFCLHNRQVEPDINYLITKMQRSWGESKRKGEGAVGREKDPTLSPTCTVPTTPRVAISTLPIKDGGYSITNINNELSLTPKIRLKYRLNIEHIWPLLELISETMKAQAKKQAENLKHFFSQKSSFWTLLDPQCAQCVLESTDNWKVRAPVKLLLFTYYKIEVSIVYQIILFRIFDFGSESLPTGLYSLIWSESLILDP